MKKLLVLSMLTLFALTMVTVEHADAKRFGGGMSFGKQRLFKQPAQRPMPQKTTPGNAQRGAAGTGMMGMIGGLAMGGLLGAIFFGGGFEGINLFDIIIFGILAYFLLRLIGNRSRMAQPTSFGRMQAATATVQGQPVTPDIDEQFFLGAAKDIFMRMQSAWDNKDMNEIRGFCTPEVAERIAAEMESLGEKSNTTEVATLDAAISDAWVESNMEWAAVHFTAMIREEEDGVEQSTHEVQEHWIFQHTPNSDDPTWYLAGIQQG